METMSTLKAPKLRPGADFSAFCDIFEAHLDSRGLGDVIRTRLADILAAAASPSTPGPSHVNAAAADMSTFTAAYHTNSRTAYSILLQAVVDDREDGKANKIVPWQGTTKRDSPAPTRSLSDLL